MQRPMLCSVSSVSPGVQGGARWEWRCHLTIQLWKHTRDYIAVSTEPGDWRGEATDAVMSCAWYGYVEVIMRKDKGEKKKTFTKKRFIEKFHWEVEAQLKRTAKRASVFLQAQWGKWNIINATASSKCA